MDEVFGEANFLAQVVVNLNPKGRQLGKGFATSHEYLLVYARDARQTRARREQHRHRRGERLPARRRRTAGATGTCRCATPTRSSTRSPRGPCTSRCTATRRAAWCGPGRSRAATRSSRSSATARRRCGAGAAPLIDERGRRPGLPADQGPARRAGRRVPEGLAAPATPGRAAQEAAHDLAGRGGRARPTPRSPSSRRSSATSSSRPSRPGWCGGSSSTMPDDVLVLDFFAGSGTTGHAVALANEEDGGTRRCISVNSAEPTRDGLQRPHRRAAHRRRHHPGPAAGRRREARWRARRKTVSIGP